MGKEGLQIQMQNLHSYRPDSFDIDARSDGGSDRDEINEAEYNVIDDTELLLDEYEEELRQSEVVKPYRLFSVKNFLIAYFSLILIPIGVWVTCNYKTEMGSKGIVFRWCLFSIIIMTCLLFGRLLMAFLLAMVKKSPLWTVRVLYYLGPLELHISFLVGSLLSLAAPIILYVDLPGINDVNLDPINDKTTKEGINKVIYCTIFAFTSLALGCLGVRIFGISFHRTSHRQRILSCLMTEYSLFSFTREKTETKVDLVEESKDSSLNWIPNINPFHMAKFRAMELLQISAKELLHGSISNYRLATIIESFKRQPYLLLQATTLGNKKLAEWERRNGESKGNPSTERLKQAKALAKFLFKRVKGNGSQYIVQDDFEFYMDSELAQLSIGQFVNGWNGKISYNDFLATVLQVMKERISICLSLREAQNSLKQLENFMSFISLIASLIFAWSNFSEINFSGILAVTSATFLTAAVALGDVMKGVLSSLFFLFISHPFDIGDRVVLEGKFFLVHKVKMLTTVMRGDDNSMVFFPNSVLSQKNIVNLRRSPDQYDTIHFTMTTTSTESPTYENFEIETKFRSFSSLIKDYMHIQNHDYYPKCQVQATNSSNSNSINVSVQIQHRGNFQNLNLLRAKRTRILLLVAKMLDRIQVRYDNLRCEAQFEKGGL